MLFYRVCHRDITDDAISGLHGGPYSGPATWDDAEGNLDRMCNAHSWVWDHPGMRLDVDFRDTCDRYDSWDDQDNYHDCYAEGCVDSLSDFVCGFTSLDALRAWFHGYRAMLRREGFVLRVWDVPECDVRQGTYQAAARHEALSALTPRVLRIP